MAHWYRDGQIIFIYMVAILLKYIQLGHLRWKKTNKLSSFFFFPLKFDPILYSFLL